MPAAFGGGSKRIRQNRSQPSLECVTRLLRCGINLLALTPGMQSANNREYVSLLRKAVSRVSSRLCATNDDSYRDVPGDRRERPAIRRST